MPNYASIAALASDLSDEAPFTGAFVPGRIADAAAYGDGVTDATAYLQGLLDAEANAGGGSVFVPRGTWRLTGPITVPIGVSFRGAGMGDAHLGGTTGTTFLCDDATASIQFGERTVANRGGASGGFTIDGNDLATVVMYVGLCVERLFEDIDAKDASGTALLVEAAQNCTFVNVNARHGDTSFVMDYGAGNNVFVRSEFESGDQWTVTFTQSGVSPSGAFPVPSYNRFFGVLVERLGEEAGSGMVLHEAGFFNRFFGSQISLGLTMGTPSDKPLVKMTNDAGGSNQLHFYGCDFVGRDQGGTKYHYAIQHNVSGSFVGIGEGCHFLNLARAYSIGTDGARINTGPNITYTSVTANFATAGAEPESSVVLHRFNQRALFADDIDVDGGQINIDGAAATNRQVFFQTAGSPRWFAGADNGAESGANAGSDFRISRYSDAGAFVAHALTIRRNTGEVILSGTATLSGALNHDGTTAGFYGATPIAKQTGVGVDAASIHAALVALGLIGA